MMARNAATEILDAGQQRVIASWAFARAVVAEAWAGTNKPFFSAKVRQRYRKTEQPEGQTWIWLARRGGRTNRITIGAYEAWRGDRLVFGTPIRPDQASVTIGIGRFALQLFSATHGISPPPLERFESSLVQVWPVEHQEVQWPRSSGIHDTQLADLVGRLIAYPARDRARRRQPPPNVRSV